jgi:hypothetical protein
MLLMMSSSLLCSLADKKLSVSLKWSRTSHVKAQKAFVPRQAFEIFESTSSISSLQNGNCFNCVSTASDARM